MEEDKIYTVDCLTGLKRLPDKIVQCCVTSPPYWGLRDYNVTGQIGHEPTPELYVDALAEIFEEVRRVLKDDGVLWLNLGDAYWGSGKAGKNKKYQARHTEFGKPSKNTSRYGLPTTGKHPELKAKDLIGLPWMVAFALRKCGWYLRQDIIWYKPNPMPESVTDRCTKAHEYLFLLSKSPRYYFDHQAIKTPLKDSSVLRLMQDIEQQKGSNRVPGKTNGPMKASVAGRRPRPGIDVNGGNQARGNIPMATDGISLSGHSGYFKVNSELIGNGTANKRSVWTVSSKPFKDAHFATYPEELIVDCIKAGIEYRQVAYVRFKDGQTGAYADNVLLLLSPKKAILHGLHAFGNKLDEHHFTMVLEVFKKAMERKPEEALILALQDEQVARLCTINCFDYLEIREQLKNQQRGSQQSL